MHITISYVIYTILTGKSDMFQYSEALLIWYHILQINCFYHFYIMHTAGIYHYPSQEIGLKTISSSYTNTKWIKHTHDGIPRSF